MTGDRQNPDGGTDTPQPRGRIPEIVATAVATALEPVTSSLGDLQGQLGRVDAHLQDNTVSAHSQMLQDRLSPLQDLLTTVGSGIVNEMGQRFTQLESDLETVQQQTDTTNQCLNELSQSVQETRNVAAATRQQVGDTANGQQVTLQHVTDLVVNSRQRYNLGCGRGYTRPFKTIPFIRTDGAIESPNDLGLPPLVDVGVMDNLTDRQLDQYLQGYGIERSGLNREMKLSKLGEHIGCAPPDRSGSHTMTFVSMLAMGCLLYLYFPQLFP
ncbi:hypothetical protein EDC04DRAFT_2696885 [Pisolithus marmoratus]|nr:hypothetical protein EDC04DRAFT_2696885 [Pisolithus marmoratus]